MGLYDHWPYTNFHELNLSWLLRLMEDLSNKVDNFVALNTIKYADPIQWNITTQYEANTVVVDPQSGTAYISSRPVPAGVALTNTDYWSVIFTLDMLSANDNITLRDDGSNIISTFASNEGDWLLWNGNLYRVSQNINLNEAYVVGYNLTRYTVELFIKDYVSTLLNMIGDLNDLSTTDKDNLVDAINEISGNLTTLSTTVGNNSTAITNINTKLSNLKIYNVMDYGALGDGLTDDTTAINDAIAAYNLTGGILYFPHAQYIITDSLSDITANGIILGNRSTINATAIDAADIVFNLTTANTVRDFAIYGDHGTAIKCSTHSMVDYCTISKFDQQIFISDAAVCTISNNYLIYPSISVLIRNDYNVDQGDHHIYGNTFSDPNGTGIGVQLESGGGTYINDNKFLGVAYAFVEAINSGATSVLNFENNSVECVVGMLFNSTQTGANPHYSNINVVGNEFATSAIGISIADNSANILIADNYFQGIGTNTSLISLGVNGGTKYPREVKISDNVLSNAQSGVFLVCNIPELTLIDNKFKNTVKAPLNANITQEDMKARINVRNSQELKTSPQTVFTAITSEDSVLKLKIRLVGTKADYGEYWIKTISGSPTITPIVTPTGNFSAGITGRTILIATAVTTTTGDVLECEIDGNFLYLNRNTQS